MPRKATGWSTTSFRDGNLGSAPGYVPGANDGVIAPESGMSNTSYRTGFSDGYVAGSTSSGFADTSVRSSFGTTYPVYPPAEPSFGSHVDVAFSGTSTRDSFDHFDSHRHSTGSSGLGDLATKIFDTVNSRFGGKHTDVAFSGTSTRSSDDFGSGSSRDFGSGGNTSFR